MPNWSDPVEMQKDFQVAILLMWFCVGLAAYDHVRYAAFDWSIITGARRRRWPQIFYFAVKLVWWAYVAISIAFIYTPNQINCQATVQIVELFMGLLCIGCSILLAARAVCVWYGRSRIVVASILGMLCAGLIVTWMMSVPNDVQVVWIPGAGNPWTEGACGFVDVTMTYSIKYAVTSLFDTVVLALTIAGVWRMRSSSRIGSLLISQGILYFVVTFAAYAVVFGLTLARLNPVLSLVGAVPSSCVAMLASTQLYAELAEEGRPMNTSDAYKGRRSSKDKTSSFFSSRARPPTLKYSLRPDLEKGCDSPTRVVSDETRNGSMPISPSSNSASGTTLDDNQTDSNSYLAKVDTTESGCVLGADLGGISVHREVFVEEAELPKHFRGSHFLSHDQLAALEGSADPVTHAVQTTFTALSKQAPERIEELASPASASSASARRKSENSRKA